jgi:hypothetical protein
VPSASSRERRQRRSRSQERGHITDGLYYGAPVTQTIDARAPTDCFRTGISDTIYDGTNHFVVG